MKTGRLFLACCVYVVLGFPAVSWLLGYGFQAWYITSLTEGPRIVSAVILAFIATVCVEGGTQEYPLGKGWWRNALILGIVIALAVAIEPIMDRWVFYYDGKTDVLRGIWHATKVKTVLLSLAFTGGLWAESIRKGG